MGLMAFLLPRIRFRNASRALPFSFGLPGTVDLGAAVAATGVGGGGGGVSTAGALDGAVLAGAVFAGAAGLDGADLEADAFDKGTFVTGWEEAGFFSGGLAFFEAGAGLAGACFLFWAMGSE